MKQKTFKKNYFLTLILVICIGLIFGIITLLSNNIFVYAESVPTYSNAELIEKYSTSCIGVNAHISLDNSKYKVENVEMDDLIVQLVPKQYFYTEGSQIGFGDDYGYFITTENKNPTQTVESDMYLSTVLVFSINTETDLMETTDRVIVTVSPEFEYRYVCLNGTGDVYIENNYISFNTSTYCVFPYAEIRGGKIEYRQTNNYYLKDISFGGTLLNEQHLNSGDIGYSAYEDYGSYFTALDYEYKGKTREYGNFPTDEAIALGLDVVDVIIGAVKTVPIIGNVVAGIEEVINIATTSKDVIDFAVGYSNYSSGKIETTEKKITTTCLYQNRKDQLANYKDANGNPALAKVAAITCNTSENKSLWYGIGDYAKAYFTVGHGDGDGVTPYYTRFVDEIALKVVYAGTDKVVEIGKGVNYDKVRSPEYKNIVTDVTETIYMLPEGENHLNYIAKYDSDYTISVNLTSEANIKINGEIYQCNKNNFSKYIQGGKGLSIDLFDNQRGLTGQVLVCPKAVDNLSISRNTFSISGNNSYLMSYTTTQNEFCKLTLNSSSCKIKILDNNLSVLKESDSSSCYFDFKAEENYYIQIINISSNSANVSITKTTPETVSVGNDYTKSLNNSEEYFSVSLEPKQYVLEYTSEYNNIFLDCPEQVVVSKITDNSKKINYAFIQLRSKQTVRFGFKGDGTVKFSLKLTENEYQWEVNDKIYGNFNDSETARLISSNQMVIQRGTEAKIRLKLGSGYIDNMVYNLYAAVGYSYKNYTLTVSTNCKLTKGDDNITLLVALDKDYIINLSIFVVHNLNLQFNEYYTDTQYGVQRGALTSLGTESVKVSYVLDYYSISNNNKEIANRGEQQIDLTANTYSLAKRYFNTCNFIDVTVKSIELTQKINGVTTITNIFNTNWSGYQTLSAIEKIHCFTLDNIKVNPLFNGGDGTTSNPFQIHNKRNLNNVRFTRDSYGPLHYMNSNFKLMNNITLSASENWEPFYGDLKGCFDGNYKTISNMKIEVSQVKGAEGDNERLPYDTQYFGLFTGVAGTVKNLTLSNVYIKSSSSHVNVGAIAGNLTWGGSLINCKVSSGTIDVKGDVCSVGGLVGASSADDVLISNCSNSATVKGDYIVGGIIGSSHVNHAGKLQSCTNNGSVSHASNLYYADSSIGGIVGYSCINIQSCVNNGSVSGYGYVGGIAGQAGSNGDFQVYQCTNYGTVNLYLGQGALENCAGGIVGYSYIDVMSCKNYATVYWKGPDSDSRDLRPCLGKLIGYNSAGYTYTTNSNAIGGIDIGSLKIVKYGFFKKYDQAQNCSTGNNAVVGYQE